MFAYTFASSLFVAYYIYKLQSACICWQSYVLPSVISHCKLHLGNTHFVDWDIKDSNRAFRRFEKKQVLKTWFRSINLVSSANFENREETELPSDLLYNVFTPTRGPLDLSMYRTVTRNKQVHERTRRYIHDCSKKLNAWWRVLFYFA